MRNWIQRWRFHRAYARWETQPSPHTLIQVVSRLPHRVYQTYTPRLGLAYRFYTQYHTITQYTQALEHSLELVEHQAYVTTQKTNTSPQRVSLDAYLSTPQGHSVSLLVLKETTLPRYIELITQIYEQSDDRQRYYVRQFQRLTEELSALAIVLHTLTTAT